MRFVKTYVLMIGLVLAMAAPAYSDAASEAFVRDNANRVLTTLDDESLDDAARTEKFIEQMDAFTNLDRVAGFVIGKYARRFSPEDLARYRTAFREYNLTAYQEQFDEYRGSEIEITGSTDRSATDSIVDTIVRRQNGDSQDVRWRVLNRNGAYQVVDVALNLDGNLIWLAIEQRRLGHSDAVLRLPGLSGDRP